MQDNRQLRKTRAAERMARSAFKRAKLMAAQVKAALESCVHLLGQPLEYKRSLDEKLKGIGPYESRGHGLNRPSYAHGRGSRGGNNAGAGVPHQNYQECNRRQRQMRRGLLDFSASAV